MTMVPPQKQLPENNYHGKLYYPSSSSSFFPTADDTFISETSFGTVGVMNNNSVLQEGYENAIQTQSSDSLLLGPSSHHNHHHHLFKSENHYYHYYYYPMAEDESRTTSSQNNEAASSSKEAPHETHDAAAPRDEEGWLQLSIGGRTTIGTTNHKKHHQQQQQDHIDRDDLPPHQLLLHPTAQRVGSTGLVELDLLTGSTGIPTTKQTRSLPSTLTSSSQHVHNLSEFPAPNPATSSNPSAFLFQYLPGSSSSFPPPPPPPHHHHHYHHHHQEIMNNNWAIRTFPPQAIVPAANSSSSIMSSSSNLIPFGSYFARPFPLQVGSTDIPGPSSGMRIVDAPRRPHSGIWFYLQASQNQAKEPFLPQIPKSYLRIKDQRTTVRLLMKYLVNKLKLDNESEIEITCRGQQLLPILTLQHVRDNIWSPRDAVTLLPESSTLDHVMILHYGRSAN